jgi:phenylacetate-coenzyme A ligase PaaK-like adenylate-forming protein
MLAHPSIRQFQIVQKSFDLIIVRLVKFTDIPQSVLEQFAKTIETAFGEKVTVQFEYPGQIPVLPSGKHRYAISELKGLNGAEENSPR